MTLTATLARLPGRCPGCAYHVATQGCHCGGDPWDVFVRAVKAAVRDDGTVHACDVRPLVRGRIEPKLIGQQWKRARREGLLIEAGHERSDDEQGRNAHRMEAYYRLATDTRPAGGEATASG